MNIMKNSALKFKNINTFWLFARKGRHNDCVYLESSREKGPCDGLGGVIKSLASTAECVEKLIRDCQELIDFLIDMYTLNIINILLEKHCAIMDCQLFLIKEEMDSFRNGLENNLFKGNPNC